MLISINSQNPQMRLLKKAAEILRSGGIIIYRQIRFTDWGAICLIKKGSKKSTKLKKEARNNPSVFVCADLKDISRYARVSDYAYKTMKRLLPGPYTFILEASRLVPKIILPKRQTTGIRVPDNRICLALVESWVNRSSAPA